MADSPDEILDRKTVLGFKPQNEVVYNKYLPYSGLLDEESQNQLLEIKTNFSKAVLLRDLSPGALHWSVRLIRYIAIYGRKFSKEDHVYFIKLFYDLVTIPELEPHLVYKFGDALSFLLKKKHLLTRNDLELPWRPLYNLYNYLVDNSQDILGMLLLPLGLDKVIRLLISRCRQFFPISSTKEMLAEWKPLMCPYDVTMIYAMNYFELFLPTNLPPEDHSQGYHLWFDDFITIWQGTHNSPSWESKLIKLFNRLSVENIGFIDWDPYIPIIFTRILRSFNLPVGNRKVAKSANTFQSSVTESWIVSMLGSTKTCQEHLKSLFKALESFYHPSNTGRWVINLYGLLSKLPEKLVKRVHRERYEDNPWLNEIPESHKLSEEDIDEFVECIKPCVTLAMFSKFGSSNASVALRNLSKLRPKLVIPDLLEKLYPALETLTEPHRLIATMNCVVSVAPELVKGSAAFPEGQSHVIPLFLLALPGIDPNDVKKCMFTFQFISTFCSLINVVDCSEAVNIRNDLTESEKEVCLATAHFENFVLEFMDRSFVLIQNSILEHTTRLDTDTEQLNSEEGIMELGLSSAFTAILNQASPAIFQIALEKLETFISGRVLETKVAGKYAASMVQSTINVNPVAALKVFFPKICKSIKRLINEEVYKEEILDDELMFNLLLLSKVLLCDGHHVLPYKKDIMDIFSKIINLTCRSGHKLAAKCLQNFLSQIVSLYPLTYRNEKVLNNVPLSEYLPIRDWGKPADLKTLNVEWHHPLDEEIDFAQDILNNLIEPKLKELILFSKGSDALSREELLRNLSIINSFLSGAAAILPHWKEEPIEIVKSAVSIMDKAPRIRLNEKVLTIENNENVRKKFADVMIDLADYINNNSEDNTKALVQIVNILQSLLALYGTNESVHARRWKGLQLMKRTISNSFAGKKKHIHGVLIERISLQHESRCLGQIHHPFSNSSHGVMSVLLRLATSHYSEVRIKSQGVLADLFNMFPRSQNIFVDPLLQILKKDPTEAHEEFKGALFVLLGKKDNSFLVNRSWNVISKVWPALVDLKHSEKPSIIKLLGQLMDCMIKKVITLNIHYEVPSSCTKTAMQLWRSNSMPLISESFPESLTIENAKEIFQQKCQNNLNCYLDMIDKLISKLESNKLHWRYFEMATQMLNLMVRLDVKFPERAVNTFFNLLIHDMINIRKYAIETCCCILKQQKPKYKTIEIDPKAISSGERINESQTSSTDVKFGHRKDNDWLLYKDDNHPDTAEKFQSSIFVHKTHWGFYTWPENFCVYSQEQECFNSKQPNIPNYAQVIFNKFTNAEFVEKLIGFLSIEDKKGKDSFDDRRFQLFKGIFRNFGSEILTPFKDSLMSLVTSTAESKQRCATEIIAGIIRGSKHWNFQSMETLKEFMVPILESALTNITTETSIDWANCMSTALESRDPNKYYWLIELLVNDPLKADQGSFLSSCRLNVMLRGLGQQEWRIPTILHRIYVYLLPHLTDSYQCVRKQISGILANMFLYDSPIKNHMPTLCPHRSDFVKQIMPILNVLNQNGMKITDETSSQSALEINNHVNDDVMENAEKKNAKNLLKLVSHWLAILIHRTPVTAPIEIFDFLPLICHYVSDTSDEELRKMCDSALARLAQALLLPEGIEVAWKTVEKVVQSNSWHARYAIISYLQVMVFSNFFTIRSQTELVSQITHLVCNLLQDEQVEVRENAEIILSGLMHCKFIEISKELIHKFSEMCYGRPAQKMPLNQLIKRHAGVLGLCACVNAHPYDVPQYIPDILMTLGDHLHDPQPIITSVKKTLSNFKRTHLDSWRDHKLKFSDDQLNVLTDLLVSPSYYA